MDPRYSEAYVEQIIHERDGDRLHQLLSVLARRATLPDDLWAFNRMLEWLGSIRSGVWQYYGGIDQSDFGRLQDWLLRVDLPELHARYTAGMVEFSAGGDGSQLDRWIDEHDSEILAALWQRVTPHCDWLKVTAGAG